MKTGVFFFSYFLFLLGIVSCRTNQAVDAMVSNMEYEMYSDLQVRYAKGFTVEIDTATGYRLLSSGYPNPTTYCLIPPNGVKTNGHYPCISLPINRFAVFSTTYIHMFECLGSLENIVGVEQKMFIYNAQLRKQIENGHTTELGEMSVLNIEKTLTVSPELIVYIGYSNTLPASLEKIQEFGIPCLPNFDWQEEHPLARAEWIKFFGVLTGKEKLADSLFNEVEKKYHSLVEVSKTFAHHPNVLFSSLYNGTWYMPGGKSYMATLLKDAGGNYPWASTNDLGSLPLSFETVAKESLHHDIWLNPDVNSVDELLNTDSRYASFLTTNKQHVGLYQYDKRKTPEGGNDYYEKGAFRVDLVLRDMIILLHPDWLSEDSLYFYRKLN
jgi:iron complex transport system substrate-binding protein